MLRPVAPVDRGYPPAGGCQVVKLVGQVMALAAALALAVAGSAAPAGAAGGTLLRYKLAVGHVSRYITSFSVGGTETLGGTQTVPVSLTLQYPNALKVTRRQADGSFWVQGTYGQASLVANGISVPLNLQNLVVDEHLAADGTALSTAYHGLPGSSRVNLSEVSIGFPRLPAQRVAVGSQWSARSSSTFGGIAIGDGVTSARLSGWPVVRGRGAATISSTTAGTVGGSSDWYGLTLPSSVTVRGFVAGASTAVVAKDTGELISLQATIQVRANLSAPNGTGTLNVTERVTVRQAP
jgi:hypothetical protein